MSDHDQHGPQTPQTQDTGSQALSEALRSSFVIVQFAMAVLIVVILFSGVFRVGPQEKAIILRFGKPVGEGQKMLLGAGLHWAFPQPIDEVIRIPISEQQQVTSTAGWYRTTPEQELAGTEPPGGSSLNPAVDNYVLTADRNIIHARAVVFYRIDDPLTAIFNFTRGTNHEFNLAGVSNAVQNAANNALMATAARFNVDEILASKATAFQEAVGQRISELVEQEQLGVAIIGLPQIRTAPPRFLSGVFEQVTTARINRDKLISDAYSEQNRILSQAGAAAQSITNAAESARVRYVTTVQSDAEAFTKLLPQYQRNPRLYVQLELTRALSQVLTNVGERYVLPTTPDGKSVELRLMLNNEPPQPKTGANP